MADKNLTCRRAIHRLENAIEVAEKLLIMLSAMDAKPSALDAPDCPALLAAWQITSAALASANTTLAAQQLVVNDLTDLDNMAANDYISQCDV